MCLCVCGGRADGVRTLLQPARAQCLRLSERFFHLFCDSPYAVHFIMFADVKWKAQRECFGSGKGQVLEKRKGTEGKRGKMTK